MSKGIKQAFLTKLTDIDTQDVEGIGSLRIEGSKVYKYCLIKNTSATVAGAAGSLVAYFAGTGYASSRVVVDLTDADTIVVCAGTLQATVTGTAGTSYWGWVQVAGIETLDTSVSSGAAGKMFYLTATDKTAAVGAAYYDQQAGVCLDGTTKVLLTCPW